MKQCSWDTLQHVRLPNGVTGMLSDSLNDEVHGWLLITTKADWNILELVTYSGTETQPQSCAKTWAQG